jgi:hypothetical protein
MCIVITTLKNCMQDLGVASGAAPRALIVGVRLDLVYNILHVGKDVNGNIAQILFLYQKSP